MLNRKESTIKDIQKELDYSYSQVYEVLEFLKSKKLIQEKSDSKPKVFVSINPKVALTELINEKFAIFKENLNKIEEEMKIDDSKYGRCLRDITFYHYSDISLAINNFHNLIQNSNNEIIMSSLPLSLLKKLEPSIYQAFMRGINIKIYFSLKDFESYPNYFEQLTDIFKRIRVEIIQTEQKTCQVVRFNDNIVNMGNILLDEIYLNAIVFKEDEVFHCDGFAGPFAKQAKNYLEILTILKRMEIEYPEPIKNILDVLEKYNSIKTRDLSCKSKIGGAKLREILEFLVNEGIIKEEVVKNEKVGRPKYVYTLKE